MSLKETKEVKEANEETLVANKEEAAKPEKENKVVEKIVSVAPGHVLNVRSTPKTDATNIVGVLKAGEKVKCFGEEGDFTVTKFKGKPAYVMTSKLR